MSDPKQEFYVGYLPQAPHGLGRFLKAGILMLLLGTVVAAAILSMAQSPYSKAKFEFGVSSILEGRIEELPFPTLMVPREGGGDSRYLLTVFGKKGADEAVAGFAGKRVRVRGTLIYHDQLTMVELGPAAIEVLAPATAEPDASDGTVAGGGAWTQTGAGVERSLIGEIVDSKCYLGVMKPGNLKTHRACATRCISGGVPPVLMVRDEHGLATYFLLTSSSGGSVGRQIVDRGLVAEPVRISGEVVRFGDLLVLKADPETYQRLD